MSTAALARSASWSERGGTSAIFLVLGTAFGSWAVSLPGIKADLSLSDRDLSLALLALALGSVMATFAAGALAPRLGTGRATIGAALALCVSLPLPALASRLDELAGLSFLFGAANGFLDISMNSHASDLERRWGLAIMSSFHGAFSIGGLTGSVIGGTLLGMGLDSFQMLAVIAALQLAVVLTVSLHIGQGSKSEAEGLGLAWPSKALWGLCAIAVLGLMVEGAMGDWSAIYLVTIVHVSDGLSAFGYAGFSVAMMIGRLSGDRVVRRRGTRPVVVGGTLLAAAGLALAVAVPSLATATLGFTMVGLGLSNVTPAVFSAAGRFGRTPAAGIAAVVGIGYAGFITGPPIIGAIASATSLRGGLGFLVVIALGAAASGLIFKWAPKRSS